MIAHAKIGQSTAELSAILRAHAENLPTPDAQDFARAFDRFADARVVLLGEATHGTHEFYAARARITRQLIEHHGFNIVAVEGDWPDIARIDDYVRGAAIRPSAGEPFARFPHLDVAQSGGACLCRLAARPQRRLAAGAPRQHAGP